MLELNAYRLIFYNLVKHVLATDHIETARQFLLDADREYEAGDILQASEKLWGAASHVVIGEMKSRGMAIRTHRQTVEAVEAFAQEFGEPSLADWFIAAQGLHRNFYNGDLDDWNFVLHRRRVHQFVNRMFELTNSERIESC